MELKEILARCDHTLRAQTATWAEIQAICDDGMKYGTACMLDGLCDRVEEEIGEPCTVVATGGLAGMVVEHCRREIIFSDMLLLDGLKLIWENHR